MKPREIVLLGYAEETRDRVFDLPENVELWGINMSHAFTFKVKEGKWLPVERLKARPTAWFQIHPPDWSSIGNKPTGYFGRPKEHIDFLQQFDGTVWLQSEEIAKELDIPNGKAFPLAQIAAASGRTYFTSSFAYQLGMAWYEHVVEGKKIGKIHAHGINLTSLDEYSHQKPCVEYWFGRLEQAGVKIEVPNASALLKGKLYAIGDGDLSDHAFDRLQHWKANYMRSRDDHIIGSTMRLELQHWTQRINQLVAMLIQKYPDIEKETEVRDQLQGWIDKRLKSIQTMTDRAAGEALKATGMVADNQHWLTLTGGIDYRATGLPDIVQPNPKLMEDFEIPEAKAI